MKRRQRRPVLELNQSHSGSHSEYVQNKRRQISNDFTGQNVPTNSLANILCHYNSDSDTEDSKKDVCKLDDQVNNFFKEIQLIAPKQPVSSESVVTPAVNSNTGQANHINQQALMWRECLDESSGYPYYWHIETNEVTWEMPDELRYLKNNVKSSSIMKQLQESHWVDFSSVTYQQSHENIPEGMIPKEVVARNRNRYIHNESAKKHEAQTDQEVANASDTMDNDSDDGKIEMITSYGSEESDSDTPDENQSKKKVSSTNETTGLTAKAKHTETYPVSTPVIQPQLPTVAQNSAAEYGNKDTVEYKKADVSLDLRSTEDIETKYLKSQVKQPSVSEETEENKTNSDNEITKECMVKKSSSKHNTNVELDFRVSLVPGYDEDSDVEEESESKQERKALFPIPLIQTDNVRENIPLSSKTTLDESQTIITNTLISNTDNDSNTERKNSQDQENEQISEKPECKEEPVTRSEDDAQKSNKFLDNLSGRSKFFQRKKRIAFDVTSVKTKTSDENESNKTEVETQREESNSCDEGATASRTDHQEQYDTTSETKVENPTNFKVEANNTLEEANISSETSNESKEDEGEVNLLSQIVLEKLKFLSEGKPGVSPVQTMSIQLQTLCVAWEGGYLEKSYLRRWLSDTSHELERLEQDAAPPGWLCQWDRSHKRYYYQNTSTGVTQWTYPDTGIAGGAEEMEICSTPPPTEQDEMILPAPEEEEEKEKEEEGVKLKSKKLQETEETSQDATAARNSDIEAPPPPQISNPSPPPPPKIYAEDLQRRDKRKQDKCNEKGDSKKQRARDEGTIISEPKQLEDPVAPSHSLALLSPQPPNLVNVSNAEPLPPGVDLTEAPYEIPASALKRIIYGAVQPQASALYDATARDPTVPILSHPAAIVQEHYLQYPAYHQHLHASAALVLPHKHSVQPAIQLIPEYTPIYTNHKIIEKPPVKTAKESLVSALDSFYNDIARIENTGAEKTPQRQDTPVAEPSSVPTEEAKVETEQESLSAEIAVKERKRKRTRIGISKKHKEMSSMVAKWQKVQQNFENT